MTREVVKFNGKPAEVELVYSTGKEGQNDNGSFYTYTLAGDKVMFASPTLNQMIQAMNPYKGMRLTIQLMKNNQWDVRPLDPPAEQPRASTPVVTPAVQQTGAYGQSNGTKPAAPALMTGQAQGMLSEFIATYEVLCAVENYSRLKGREVQFSSEDFRAVAISCYIAQSRNGGPK